MNANQLADELQAVLFACGKERPFLEHAKMLLQLQAENEALKAVLKEAINGMGHNHQAKFKEYLK